ncbi:hypothetical protein SCLCIDRAFT_1213991, partial [Scleroderma citrinum Foug A]
MEHETKGLPVRGSRTSDFVLASNAGYWKNKGDTSVEKSMTRDCGLVPIMFR